MAVVAEEDGYRLELEAEEAATEESVVPGLGPCCGGDSWNNASQVVVDRRHND